MNNTKTLQTTWAVTLLLLTGFVLSAGCSGRPKNVARSVTGKVTLGGEPLVGATVIFTPTAEGSASFGTTDATGTYKLIWAQQRGKPIEGAQIGEHTVKISTFQEADSDSVPPVVGAAEKVPFKYRQEGGYPPATVIKGSNVIDFALEPGPVDAPQPKTKGKRSPNLRSADC